MQKAKQIQIDIIRHGEPEGGEVIRGRTDHQLTPHGQAQFTARIKRHASPWDYIISSPLARCLTAAQQLSTSQNIPLQVDNRLRELDFGDWENQPIHEVMADKQAQILWQNPLQLTPPNGEPVAQLRERLRSLWQELHNYRANSQILLVCHGGVMRVLMHDLFHLPDKTVRQLHIPFAGFIRLQLTVQQKQSCVMLELFDGQQALELTQ